MILFLGAIGISPQQTFSVSAGIVAQFPQISLCQERDLKSENIADLIYGYDSQSAAIY